MQIDAFLYLIIMVIIGYLAIKIKLLPGTIIDTLPPLLTNLCYPAMILTTFTSLDMKEFAASGLTIAIVTFVVTLLLYFTGRIIFRNFPRPQRILFNFMLGIGNVTYVGIPLISIFFGSEGVYYALIHGAVQDILIWFLYYPTYLGKKENSKSHILSNPCLIALTIGVLFGITGIQVPGLISTPLNHISSMTSVIALLFLGGIIAKYGALGWIKSTSSIMISVIKVLVLPLLLFGVLTLCVDRYTALLLSVLFACPTPIMSIVWAGQYDGDIELSTNCCICSTILYLIMISILLLIISSIGWI